MRNESTLTKEKKQKRLDQSEEMSLIWERSTKEVQMYLKGCMVTAAALAGLTNPEKQVRQQGRIRA